MVRVGKQAKDLVLCGRGATMSNFLSGVTNSRSGIYTQYLVYTRPIP